MYGILLECVQHYIQLEYGNQKWNDIIKVANCKHAVFNTHQIYPDKLILSLASACSELTSASYESFMSFFGKCFVRYCSHFGYDSLIKATGRYFTEFLESVDNIHEQFSFTFPKMKSPSLHVTDINEGGCVLVYKSSRNGFNDYIRGILDQIARDFFQLKLKSSVLRQTKSSVGNRETVEVRFKLEFNNVAYMIHRQTKSTLEDFGRIFSFSHDLLLQLFPFAVMYDEHLTIIGAGENYDKIWLSKESFYQQSLLRFFKFRRPKNIRMTWKNIISLKAVMFEMECNRGSGDFTTELSADGGEMELHTPSHSTASGNVLLKGQMKYIPDSHAIIFLCTPIINDIEDLTSQNLYLNDLNFHGLSREMVLAGWQHHSKLQIMFDKAEQRAQELEDSYELLDRWRKRGDDLLYSMIPKTVADRLRNGESPLSTCEGADAVTILFCELVGLLSETVEETMNVVMTMNSVFSCFDALMDKYHVYKVETVGKVYMAASGAPERTELHAQNIADVAIAMMKKAKDIKWKDGKAVEIKIGIHSGAAVTGVVGSKVPRYCFFGDTVNTASRMQSTSEPGKIQITIHTANLLPKEKYQLKFRGPVKVKGKGDMNTYWLWNNRN